MIHFDITIVPIKELHFIDLPRYKGTRFIELSVCLEFVGLFNGLYRYKAKAIEIVNKKRPNKK